jgi:hypothetical protein
MTTGEQHTGGAVQAVVGFMPDAMAKNLHAGHGFGHDQLEMPLDPEKGGATLRVRSADIEEVRLGPSRAGHTGVQLVLKPNASYEIVAKGGVSADALTTINDPGLASALQLWWLRFVIYAGPIYRQNARGQLQEISQQIR